MTTHFEAKVQPAPVTASMTASRRASQANFELVRSLL